MPEKKELEVEEVLSRVFEDFDSVIDKLDAIPSSAETKTNELLQLFFPENAEDDIFNKPNQIKFLQALNNLNEQVGHAYHTVLTIELARQRINPQKMEDLASLFSKPQDSRQPIIVQPAAPSQISFPSMYLYARSVIAAAKTIAKTNEPTTPQISTSREVVDVLEFGRQLIPEFNRIQEYYQQCLDHLYFFNDNETRERFHSELCKHMNKIAGIIRTFCRTIAEYRKELVGEGKRDIAKAIIALKMMQEAEPGLPVSPMATELLRQSQRKH